MDLVAGQNGTLANCGMEEHENVQIMAKRDAGWRVSGR